MQRGKRLRTKDSAILQAVAAAAEKPRACKPRAASQATASRPHSSQPAQIPEVTRWMQHRAIAMETAETYDKIRVITMTPLKFLKFPSAQTPEMSFKSHRISFFDFTIVSLSLDIVLRFTININETRFSLLESLSSPSYILYYTILN